MGDVLVRSMPLGQEGEEGMKVAVWRRASGGRQAFRCTPIEVSSSDALNCKPVGVRRLQCTEACDGSGGAGSLRQQA